MGDWGQKIERGDKFFEVAQKNLELYVSDELYIYNVDSIFVVYV